MAGYYARQASAPMTVVPLVKETTGPRLVYRIAMGVRFADQDWKRLLNRLIAENQGAINKVLLGFAACRCLTRAIGPSPRVPPASR